MKVAIYYESKSGNNQKIAERLGSLLSAKNHQVEVHHIDSVNPKNAPPADLYVFSSPTRIGKPVRSMRGFVKKINMPPGAKYVLIATHIVARPDKKTGKIPTPEEMAKWRRTIPVLDEIAREKGTKIAEEKIFVMDMTGPLEEEWEKKVEALAEKIS